MRKVVIDTNVLLSALKSKRGASYLLLSLIAQNKFDFYLSVPLVLEYEELCLREIESILLSENEIQELLEYICSVGINTRIFYLWRPFLKDFRDDLVLELAFSSGCESIITYNLKDFKNVEKVFGIRVITPKQFLNEIGEI